MYIYKVIKNYTMAAVSDITMLGDDISDRLLSGIITDGTFASGLLFQWERQG